MATATTPRGDPSVEDVLKDMAFDPKGSIAVYFKHPEKAKYMCIDQFGKMTMRQIPKEWEKFTVSRQAETHKFSIKSHWNTFLGLDIKDPSKLDLKPQLIYEAQLWTFELGKDALWRIKNCMSGSYLCYRGNREYAMSGEVNVALQWRVLDIAAINDVTSDNIFSLLISELTRKAFVTLNSGIMHEAEQFLDQEIKENENNWFAWKYKGYLRLQAKDYDKAIEALSQALRIEEKWSFAWAKLGYAFIKQKRYYEALPCYAKALEYTPGDVTSLYYKGKAHFHTQDFNEARACFDKVLEQPQNFKNSYYYKGKMLVTEQKISMAIQCFNKALERSPNKVTVHNEKGLAQMKLGNVEDALDCFTNALILHPKDTAIWNNKGAAFRDLRKYKNAMECFKTAIKIDGNCLNSWVNLGLTYGTIGKYEKAINCLQKALEISPKHEDAPKWTKEVKLFTDIMGNHEVLELQKKGDDFYLQRQFDKALEVYCKAKEITKMESQDLDIKIHECKYALKQVTWDMLDVFHQNSDQTYERLLKTYDKVSKNSSKTVKVNEFWILNKINIGALAPEDITSLKPKQLIFLLPIILGYIRDFRDAESRLPFITAILDKLKESIKLQQLIVSLNRSNLLVTEVQKIFTEDEWQKETFNFFAPNAQGQQRTFTKGQVFNNLRIAGPLYGYPVFEIKVAKVFDSKAKPVLLEYQSGKFFQPLRAIFKTGDDLRKDFLVEVMFFIFNKIWENSGLKKKPHVYQYLVIPSGTNAGFIEFVPDCTPVKSFDWNRIDSLTEREVDTLVQTAAGGFVAAFIMGIRDRHKDNMLIKDNTTFVHIDFGYLFNEKTWFDAPSLAIPGGLKTKLESKGKWEEFKNLMADAYLLLRRNSGMISNICLRLFKGISPTEVVENQLYTAFQMFKTSEDMAWKDFKDSIDRDLTSLQKKLKDVVHKIESQSN